VPGRQVQGRILEALNRGVGYTVTCWQSPGSHRLLALLRHPDDQQVWGWEVGF